VFVMYVQYTFARRQLFGLLSILSAHNIAMFMYMNGHVKHLSGESEKNA
jgi:hypothetical protein